MVFHSKIKEKAVRPWFDDEWLIPDHRWSAASGRPPEHAQLLRCMWAGQRWSWAGSSVVCSCCGQATRNAESAVQRFRADCCESFVAERGLRSK